MQQLKVTREIDVTGATKLGFGGDYYLAGNKVLFVDGSGTAGNNGNEGTNPNYPKDTIDNALDSCTDDKNDYIFVLDCYEQDTEPISLDKSRCHIIGLSMPTPWCWATLNGGGTDIIRIAANYVEFAGFSMISAAADGIHFYSNVGYGWIHDCNFAVAAVSLANGIEFDSTYGTNSLIEGCTFGATTSHITGYGIYGGAHQCTIRNNTFKECADDAIHITGTINTGNIYGNLITVSDDANGEAITLNSGVSGFMVTNNYAMYGMLSGGATYNPYEDLAANTSNHWGMNYRGNAVIEPVGA